MFGLDQKQRNRFIYSAIFTVFLTLLGALVLNPFANEMVFAQKNSPKESAETISADDFVASEAGKLFKSGDYEAALEALSDLLEKYPRDPLLLRYRAIALDRLGRSDEAIQIFQDILSENPSHVPTHYFLGQAFARKGDSKAAIREWKWVAKEGRGTPYEVWALDGLERAGEIRISEEEKKILRWYVLARYGYEYDTNVTLRPDDGMLSATADNDAGRQVLDLALRYRVYSRRDLAVDLLYATRQTFHDDSLNEFNFHSEEFGLNLRKRVRMGDQDVVLGARYEALVGFLEDDLFSVRNRWHLSADTRLTARTRTVFYDRMTLSDFGPDGSEPAKTSRDGFYNDAGVTHYWYTSDYRSFLYLRQEFNSTHTRGRNFDLIGSTSRIGIHTPLLEKLDLDVSSGLELNFYHHFSSISSGDLSRRRDIKLDIYGALTYHLTPHLGLRGFYRYFNANNQNNFYEYTRHIGGAQMIYNINF